MTKFKNVSAGVLSIGMFLALSLSYAQDAPGPDGLSSKWRPGQHIHEIFNQLNLTDDQKKQLDANKKQHRTEMENARQQMKSARDAFQQELMKPTLDMSRINAIHNQIKTLQSQMEDNKLNSILAVRAILTPEQFLKFLNLMGKHRPDHD